MITSVGHTCEWTQARITDGPHYLQLGYMTIMIRPIHNFSNQFFTAVRKITKINQKRIAKNKNF